MKAGFHYSFKGDRFGVEWAKRECVFTTAANAIQQVLMSSETDTLEVKAKQGPLDRAVQTDPSSTREAGEDGYITDVRNWLEHSILGTDFELSYCCLVKDSGLPKEPGCRYCVEKKEQCYSLTQFARRKENHLVERQGYYRLQ